MTHDTNNALPFLEDIGYVYALYPMMLFSIFIKAYHFKILSLSILNIRSAVLIYLFYK